MGRLDARWHGFIYLCVSARAIPARVVTALGHWRDQRKHRLLWRPPIRFASDRLGPWVFVGPCGRQIRSRAHSDANDSMVFRVHLAERIRG